MTAEQVPPPALELFPIAADAQPIDLRGDTLLVPAVSIGSVPQLSFDLLIHAQQQGQGEFERLAYVSASEWCVPFVAPHDSVASSSKSAASAGHNGLTAALELYRSPARRVSLLHQRSPVLKAHKNDFVKGLREFAKAHAFKEVVVVASIDAGMRIDSEMDEVLLHWSSVQQGAEAADQSVGAKIRQRIPRFQPRPIGEAQRFQGLPRPAAEATAADPLSPPPLPSAGLTRRILAEFAQSKEQEAPPCTALLMFCSEGDNRADAHALASYLANTIGIQGHRGELARGHRCFCLRTGADENSFAFDHRF